MRTMTTAEAVGHGRRHDPNNGNGTQRAAAVLARAADRVRKLHPEGDTPFCAYCAEPYPCTTVPMLDAPPSRLS